MTGVEVIPRAELGRPRVDTVLSIGGLYRDNLPEVMQASAERGGQGRGAGRRGKSGRSECREDGETLLARGVEPGRAKRLARCALFANESGVYGSKLAPRPSLRGYGSAKERSRKSYLDRMSYAYGPDPDTRNVKLEGDKSLFGGAKGNQSRVLSRSSNAYGTLSTPTIHSISGRSRSRRATSRRASTPELYSPTCATRAISRRNLSRNSSASNCVRAMFHPRYIQELMNERYAGANQHGLQPQ